MTVQDLTLVLWIVGVTTVVYVGLPLAVRRLCGPGGPPSLTLVSGLLVWTVAGVTLLAAVGMVNAVTVVGLHAAYGAAVFFGFCRGFDGAAQRLLRTIATLYERVTLARRAGPRTTPTLRRWFAATLPPGPEVVTRPQLAACAILAATAGGTRVWLALTEARLLDPAAYEQLYVVRRLLGDTGWGVTVGGPIWAAAIATLGAVDAASVVRFLPALLACAVTWALARAVIAQGGRLDAAFVAIVCWFLASSGAAADSPWAAVLSRQHAASGEYVAALLLFALIHDDATEHGGHGAWHAVAAVLFAPALGVIAAVALAFPNRIRVGIVAAGWVGIAASGVHPDAPAVLRGAAATLPLAMAFAAGLIWAALPRDVRLPERSTAATCGVLVALAGFTVLPPVRVLERDETARQSLRIVRESRPGEWTIAANSAPLLRGLEGAQVLSLPVFIACASGAAIAECVAAQRTTTYVFVEKRPDAAADLGNEQAALLAAERLAHASKGARIDYEDDTVRIYRVPPQPWPL